MNEETGRDPSAAQAAQRSRATEYVVIAAIILVIVIGAVTLLGERISGMKEDAPAEQAAPLTE